MDIAIPLFDRFTALDAIGPYEVLSRLPGATVHFLGPAARPVSTDNGMLAITAPAAWEDVPHPDVLVVPGGIGTRSALHDERLLDWLREVHGTAQWTTSVCTGSLLLAAAGLLSGVEATTHWAARELLASLGARPVAERVVQRTVDGHEIVTAAGVSAGIDMALTLAARITGEDAAMAIQLAIEYDPQPPFDSGSPDTASPQVLALARTAQAAENH